MIDEREVWIKRRDHTPEGERTIRESRAQNRELAGSPDHVGDSRKRSIPTFSFKPLAVVFALLLGWVALVLVLRMVLPTNEQAKVVRGAAYLAYIVVAVIVVARSIKNTHSKND